jgi:DegV family protein with EDD domain
MVAIVTDTTAALPPEIVERYKVPIIPQIINIGNESYREGIDIDTETFVRRLRTERVLPKTAAPPPHFFSELFQRLVPGGEPIVCLHPSCEVSGTVRSAQLAAAEFPSADIRVVDTRTIAYALGTIVTLACGWAAEGESVEAIMSRIQNLIKRSRIYFRVPTLEYLARGGRIGGAAALLGSVLQVKPILTLRDGFIDQYARERTEHHALARLTRIIAEQCPFGDTGMTAMMYDGTLEQREPVEMLARTFGSALGREPFPLYGIPPAIITHAGPGVIGVGFFTAES